MESKTSAETSQSHNSLDIPFSLKTLGVSVLATLAACTTPRLNSVHPTSSVVYPEIEELKKANTVTNPHTTDPENLPFDSLNSELYNLTLPKAPTIDPVKLARVFVADGAFLQGNDGSMSNWMANLAATINLKHDDLKIDVRRISFSERTEIKRSSDRVLEMIVDELKDRPLLAGEEIVLMGHSQGALILSYAMRQHERHADYHPEFPWEKVRGLISVDIPLKVLRGYEGPLEGLVDPLAAVGRVDPLVIPLVCAIFYPAANDYLGKSEVLKVCKYPAQDELRLSRTYANGKPVQINVKAEAIDNPESLWSHHLFAKENADEVHEKDARTKLVEMCLKMLKVE